MNHLAAPPEFMRYLILLLLLGNLPLLRAEPTVVQARARQSPEALQEINAGLWQPLSTAFVQGDIAAYRACFAADAIIASGDMPTLNPVSSHLQAVARRFMLQRERAGYGFEPRFTERAIFGGLSAERGILAVTVRDAADGKLKTNYREFHAFARQLDGAWRIAVWYEKTLEGPEAAAAFAAAAPLGNLDRF